MDGLTIWLFTLRLHPLPASSIKRLSFDHATRRSLHVLPRGLRSSLAPVIRVFFHGLPPTEKTAGDPYFIFPADLKRTLLTRSLSHHFGLPEMGWRPLSKMCHFCNVGEKKDGSLEPRLDCSMRHYFDTFLRPLPPFEMLKRQISEIRCAA